MVHKLLVVENMELDAILPESPAAQLLFTHQLLPLRDIDRRRWFGRFGTSCGQEPKSEAASIEVGEEVWMVKGLIFENGFDELRGRHPDQSHQHDQQKT